MWNEGCHNSCNAFTKFLDESNNHLEPPKYWDPMATEQTVGRSFFIVFINKRHIWIVEPTLPLILLKIFFPFPLPIQQMLN